jgi:hypothetical protein
MVNEDFDQVGMAMMHQYSDGRLQTVAGYKTAFSQLLPHENF